MCAQGVLVLGIPMIVASLLIVLIFGALRVEVLPEGVVARLGIGLISRKIEFKDVIEVEQASDPWSYGWGLRRTPYGWLYRVAGCDAVHFKLVDGTIVGVGTDRPGSLLSAIQAAVGSPSETQQA